MARLRLTIQGQIREISIDSFIDSIQNSLEILQELDRAVSRERSGTIDWVVSGLGIGSTYVEVESRVRSGNVDHASQITTQFADGIEHVQKQGTTPPFFSVDSMRHMRNIVRLIGRKGMGGLLVSLPDIPREVHLSREAEENLEALVGVHHKSTGAVEGRLELVSIHHPYRRFNVYHSVTQKSVKCNLPKEFERQVINSLGRRVIASGIVSYNVKGEPLSVEVQKLRVLRSEDELPSIDDILGIAPDITGDLSTEEYIRSVRGG